MKKIDLGVVVTTLIIVTISCSLAFFAAKVIGNPKDINLVAKNVAITFTDTSSIASDVISPGWNNVKTFTITNNSKEDFSYNITLKGLVNTFESINTLQYKITSDNGYNMDNYLNVIKTETSKDVVLAYNITIPKNTKQSYQVEFNYVSTEEDQSGDMGKKLGGTLAIEASNGSPEIYDKLLADNPTIKTRTDFGTTLTETNVNTLYKATEDNTDVYYFAGDARNNWVKFGGYYWRIIRTNSDGSIRILYHGTSTTATDAYIGKTCWYKDSSGNCINNSENYLYYTYDDNESEIKKMVESWYASNLINYDKYISKNAIYCNDKEYQSFDIPEIKVFNAYVRATGQNGQNSDWTPIYNGKISPTYNCNTTESQYTYKYSGIGNQLLSYPIGLITADETVYAGSSFELNNGNIWHIKNSDLKSSFGDNNWWTMSPSIWNTANSYNSVVRSTYARIEGHASYEDYYVRPVISIKGDNTWKSGDGSAEHPYEIEDFTSLKEQILADNPTIKTRTDFSTTFTETNNGTLFTSTESLNGFTPETVYYFSGNAQNNWVKFAGYYWRIIRTNSDGSIRLLYHSTNPYSADAYIGATCWYKDASGECSSKSENYLKYTYDGNESESKKMLENWYESSLLKYQKYIDTNAVYCSDLEYKVFNIEQVKTYNSYIRISGISSFNDDWTGIYSDTISPSFNCNSVESMYTYKKSGSGNKLLNYPIGLITGDELVFAGGKFGGENSLNYFNQNANNEFSLGYYNSQWYTMSPSVSYSSEGNAYVLNVHINGSLYNQPVESSSLIRPVISVKGDNVYKSGNGSPESPYEIVLN